MSRRGTLAQWKHQSGACLCVEDDHNVFQGECHGGSVKRYPCVKSDLGGSARLGEGHDGSQIFLCITREERLRLETHLAILLRFCVDNDERNGHSRFVLSERSLQGVDVEHVDNPVAWLWSGDHKMNPSLCVM